MALLIRLPATRSAAAGYDKTIYIWTLGETEGALKQSLIADEESILSLVWSPDGQTIITASSDGSIRFRDAGRSTRYGSSITSRNGWRRSPSAPTANGWRRAVLTAR